MTTEERPAAPERSTAIGRWRWVLVAPTALCIAACLAIAFSTPVARLFFDWDYESKATIEVADNRPLGEQQPPGATVAQAALEARIRMLSWESLREIVLSRKVDFGREIDPDDRRQLERVYHEVLRRTVVSALGGRHIVVSHRSRDPKLNASLVNELVKKFITEGIQEAQDPAKTDLKYCRDMLAAAKTHLSEVDGQIREFNQQHPWLTGTLAEIHQKYKDAEDEEGAIKRQMLELENTILELRKELAKEKPESTPEHSNPRYEAVKTRIEQSEKDLRPIEVRKLDASKKVSEWYVKQRKAPELLAERRALEEQRTNFGTIAKEYETGIRAAEMELNRLLTFAYSSRFRVIEYARADEVAQSSVNDVQAYALACAVGMVLALSPFLTMGVLSRFARRRRAGDQAAPRRASTLAPFAVGSACVLLPFAALIAAVALHLSHTPPAPLRGEAAKHEEPTILGPVPVESFWKGDIKFMRIGGDGLVTGELHVFREMLPEKAKVFTANLDSEVRGTILEYRLRQVATGEVYTFADVEVKEIAGEWMITEEGWRKIKGDLQAKLGVSLGGPIN